MKRIISLFVFVLLVTLLASCKPGTFSIEFNSNGGTTVSAVEVKKNEELARPSEPTKEGFVFNGWFKNENFSGEAYDFSEKVVESFTLYAMWLNLSDFSYIRFVDHHQNTSSIVMGNDNGIVTPPTNPERSGYKFGGWFSTKRGLTWNDLNPYDFTQKAPVGGVEVYAYWEPVNSKTHAWSDAETYFSTLNKTTTYVLNPLNYEYADEIDLIRNLSTPLYTQEVDWGKAIEDGIADFPGDFSKIGITEGKFGIDLLKNHYILAGAVGYPKNQDGHDLVDEKGNWDPDAAGSFQDSVWTIQIRDDLKFEDGRKITAHDFVYTYKQYIDPIQINKRGSTFFPTQDRRNGYKIVNARSYFVQGDETLLAYEIDNGLFTGTLVDGKVVYEDVGFKALDDYTLQLTFEDAVAQTNAVGLMNNFYLVHPEKFAASLDQTGRNSNYGTPLNPYVSYGAYIIKTWDEGAKYVLNKNYDYVLKHTVNYKSLSYQYTDDIHENMQLFKAGKLSGVGLLGEYAKEYAEWKNNYPTYRGYPFSLDMNMTDQLSGDRKANPIMLDINFRKALLYGFERQEFTSTVYAPNTPSLMIWPIEAKQYVGDEFWYKDTPEHKEVLELLELNEQTAGYDKEKAIQYFELAYNEWKKTHSGTIIIDFLVRNQDTHKENAQYIKQHFEQLFGEDKIKFEMTILDDTVLFARQDDRDFDLTIDSSGWGFADATFVYMPLKGLYYTWLFGDDAGMNSFDAIPGLDGAMFYKPINMQNTLDYLVDTKYEREEDEATPAGLWDEKTAGGTTLELYEHLLENDGFYVGEAETLFYYLVYDNFVYAKNEEPFPGAVDDLTRISAAYEYIILDLVTHLPVASLTSVVAYAENVVIEWPFYSYELGWGSARYRYLNTDIDYQ